LLCCPNQDTTIYRLTDDLAIVQAVAFFPPIVNDPFQFGGIAAAHALGAIYATGATPRTGFHLVGYPEDDDASLTWLVEILHGGAERFQEANATLAGSYSLRDAEIKFGFAVTGTIHPQKILGVGKAQPGDKLVLTKALGTGIVAAAHKADACPEDVFQAACASMNQLNDIGRDAMLEVGGRAAGAVKGLGLARHALEMAQASQTTLVIDLAQVPVLAGAEKLARKPYLSRAAAANAAETGPTLRKEGKLDAVRLEFFQDPQTSGGLLLSVPAAEAEILVQKCRGRGALATAVIGEVVQRQDVGVVLRP
jgi:selenide,water dikinase